MAPADRLDRCNRQNANGGVWPRPRRMILIPGKGKAGLHRRRTATPRMSASFVMATLISCA